METNYQVFDNGWRYGDIIKDMLEQVPDKVDKREGSIMYNTLAPSAYFLARQNFMLGFLMGLQLFADTATGQWLDRVTNDFGINREPATKAHRHREVQGRVRAIRCGRKLVSGYPVAGGQHRRELWLCKVGI